MITSGYPSSSNLIDRARAIALHNRSSVFGNTLEIATAVVLAIVETSENPDAKFMLGQATVAGMRLYDELDVNMVVKALARPLFKRKLVKTLNAIMQTTLMVQFSGPKSGLGRWGESYRAEDCLGVASDYYDKMRIKEAPKIESWEIKAE